MGGNFYGVPYSHDISKINLRNETLQFKSPLRVTESFLKKNDLDLVLEQRGESTEVSNLSKNRVQISGFEGEESQVSPQIYNIK